MSTNPVRPQALFSRWYKRFVAFVLTAATAVLALATVPSDASTKCLLGTKLVPSCGVLWGLYSIPVADKSWQASYTGLEGTVGRQFDIVKRYHDFSGVGPNGVFPNEKEQELGNGGRILYFSWNSINYSSGKHANWDGIASGKYDATRIVPVAQQVKKWGKRVFIDFDHEADSKVLADRGRPAEYVAAYRHIEHIFDQVGATNVVWTWVTTGYTGHASTAKALYPGDDYIDWIGWDPYNYYQCLGQPWRSPTEVFNRWYKWLGQNGFGDKPYMISEYGSVPKPGTDTAKGDWYRGIPNALKQLPKIKAMVIFNSNKRCDFRVHKSLKAMAGFKSAANSDYVSRYH